MLWMNGCAGSGVVSAIRLLLTTELGPKSTKRYSALALQLLPSATSTPPPPA
jgi:hypothetical protein